MIYAQSSLVMKQMFGTRKGSYWSVNNGTHLYQRNIKIYYDTKAMISDTDWLGVKSSSSEIMKYLSDVIHRPNYWSVNTSALWKC